MTLRPLTRVTFRPLILLGLLAFSAWSLTACSLLEPEDNSVQKKTQTVRKPLKKKKKLKGTAEDYLLLARKAASEDNADEAARQASCAIQLDPKCAEAYFIRGKGLYNSAYGDEAQALKDMQMCAQLNPDYPRVWEYLGRLYESQDQFPSALKAFSKAIEKSPAERDLYKFRAALFSQQHRPDEALLDYNHYVDMQPGKMNGYTQRGVFFESQGRDQEALADFTKAIAVEPTDFGLSKVEAYKRQARLLIRLNREKEAIETLKKLVKIDRNDDDGFEQLGLAHVRLKKYPEAVEYYTRAIEANPDFARTSYEGRALAYEKLGKSNLAKVDRATALAIKRKPAEKPIYELKQENQEPK